MSQGGVISSNAGAMWQRPHFLLVPLLAPGHIIPALDLAHLLARRGALVSFVTTPLNASRIKDTIGRARESGASVRVVELRFPCAEADLPDGYENADTLDKLDYMFSFFKACGLLREPLELYLREQEDPPNCIISDYYQPWTHEVATSLGVPRLTFFSMPCFTLLSDFNIWRHKVYDTLSDKKETFRVPGLLDQIEVTWAQAPGFFPWSGDDWEKLAKQVRDAELATNGIVVNTFDDLERWYIDSYAKTMAKKVWSIGPVSLYHESIADKVVRGKTSSIDAGECLSWLDSMKPNSVIYVSFGSLAIAQAPQLIEIGNGLEASGHPFIWVIKDGERSEEVEAYLAERFEGGTSARALIVKGWAPQVMILSHPAVGGFMTHCGWNSTLESIAAGVPMVTWPQFSDQFLNERMVVDVLGIGVPVGVKEPTAMWGPEDPLARADDVERAVRSLMDGASEEAGDRRKRAKALGEKAKEAMREGGSSYCNMADLIMHFSGPGI